MSENHEYKYLLADYWSKYQGLFIKGPRKLRAEFIYSQTVGEDPSRPQDIASYYELPLEAVLEAIHYCTHNEEFLRQEWEREAAEWREFDKKHPPLMPPGYQPQP